MPATSSSPIDALTRFILCRPDLKTKVRIPATTARARNSHARLEVIDDANPDSYDIVYPPSLVSVRFFALDPIGTTVDKRTRETIEMKGILPRPMKTASLQILVPVLNRSCALFYLNVFSDAIPTGGANGLQLTGARGVARIAHFSAPSKRILTR